MITSIEETIAHHRVLDGLDDDIIALITGCAVNAHFAAGEYIFREAEDAESFFLIRQGTVALEMHMPGREPFVFLTLKEGEMLGISWLFPPYQWSYDARAVELTRAIRFDARCLRDKCEQDNRVGYQLMKRFVPPLVERLRMARVQSADLYGHVNV